MDPSQDPLPPDVLSVLQHRTLNTPLLPGLKTFVCREATVVFIPFIPLFLSPGIAVIDIKFAGSIPALMIASMIATFSTLCPNLLEITLRRLPLDEVITTAVSNMLLACNLDALRKFEVDSLLTTAAYEVLYRLPNLRELFTIFLGDTLLPPVLLPNLVGMEMTYLFGHEWLRRLNGATLNKLTSVFFHTASLDVGDFLEAFESFALATSISTKLSTFVFYSYYPWNPNYSSLLGFKQLTELIIITPCHVGCSSAVGDDIVINLARAMPKLKVLLLGSDPCPIPTGVTVKGLVELACHCIDLCTLRVHIRVDSLVQAAAGDVVTSPSTAEPASIPRAECALTNLGVGNMPIQEGSALTVALALLHIFPRISQIKYTNPHWRDVQNTITLSKRLSNRIGALARFSSKAYPQRLRVAY